MNLKSLITRFKNDEDGAVTVDWVVLTAGLVGLAAIIGTTVGEGVGDAAGRINTGLSGEMDDAFGAVAEEPAS